MNSGEFIRAGQCITGKKRGYQLPLALSLGISVRMVQYYASGACTVTKPIRLLMLELLKNNEK
jgi:hypothetical protein